MQEKTAGVDGPTPSSRDPLAATPGSGVIAVLVLTLRDLRHRLVRFVIITFVSGLVFAMLFLMNGIVAQFHREPAETTRSFGADRWLMGSGVTGPFTSISPMSIYAGEGMASEQRAPFVLAITTMRREGRAREVVIVGHDASGLAAPRVVDGRASRAVGEIVTDRTAGAAIGSQVEISNHPFTVVGHTRHATVLAGLPLVYVSLREAQDTVFSNKDIVSGFLLRGHVGSPMPGTVLLTNAEIAKDTFHPLAKAVTAINLVRGLLWIIAAILVGAVVYLSAMERHRDFAVLKAVGSADRKLAGGLAIQAVLVALVAVAVGSVLQMLLKPAFPLRIAVPAADYVRLPVLAVAAALVAAAAGMRRVVRTDPATAFAGA